MIFLTKKMGELLTSCSNNGWDYTCNFLFLFNENVHPRGCITSPQCLNAVNIDGHAKQSHSIISSRYYHWLVKFSNLTICNTSISQGKTNDFCGCGKNRSEQSVISLINSMENLGWGSKALMLLFRCKIWCCFRLHMPKMGNLFFNF